MLNFDDLRPYQNAGIDFAYDHDEALLLCPMGAGKTVIAFTTLEELLHNSVISRALVVAPRRVCEMVWATESALWSHLAHLKVAEAIGPPTKRKAAIESDAQIVVINYENLVWLLDEYPKKIPFDALVLDELSKMKSTNSGRYRALRPRLDEFSYRLGMTASFTSEGLEEAFAQVYCVDRGKSLGRSVTTFRNQYFVPDDPNGWSISPREGALEEVTKAIRDLAYLVDNKDYADQLPPLMENIIELPMPAKNAYTEMRETWALGDIESANAGGWVNKLRQIVSGFIYTGSEEEHGGPVPEYEVLHNDRVEALKDLIDEQQGSPVLIAYNYQAELDMLQKALPGATLSKDTINQWNQGQVPILYVHPKSGGHGLNLQYGGDTIIWYTLPWSRDEFEQMTARLHRGGAKGPVWSHILQAKGTIDTEVLKALKAKGNVQKAVLDALR